ncbi:MAG: hypothetical protein RL154_612 [Pseudomonadota bacterium]
MIFDNIIEDSYFKKFELRFFLKTRYCLDTMSDYFISVVLDV